MAQCVNYHIISDPCVSLSRGLGSESCRILYIPVP